MSGDAWPLECHGQLPRTRHVARPGYVVSLEEIAENDHTVEFSSRMEWYVWYSQ